MTGQDAVDAIARRVVEMLVGPPENLIDQLAERLVEVVDRQRQGMTGAQAMTSAAPPPRAIEDWPESRSRLRKAICSDCGYTIRVTKRWLSVGVPVCPCGGLIEPESRPRKVPASHEGVMIELAGKGLSTRRIASELTARGLVAPHGGRYSHTTVGQILRRHREAIA